MQSTDILKSVWFILFHIVGSHIRLWHLFSSVPIIPLDKEAVESNIAIQLVIEGSLVCFVIFYIHNYLFWSINHIFHPQLKSIFLRSWKVDGRKCESPTGNQFLLSGHQHSIFNFESCHLLFFLIINKDCHVKIWSHVGQNHELIQKLYHACTSNKSTYTCPLWQNGYSMCWVCLIYTLP